MKPYVKIVYMITMWFFNTLKDVVTCFIEDPLKETGRLLFGVSICVAIIGYVLTLFGEGFWSKYFLLFFAPVLTGIAAMIYLVVACDNITEPWILHKRNVHTPIKGWAIQISILTTSMLIGGWLYLDGVSGFITRIYNGEAWGLNALELTIALPTLFVGLSILQETIWRMQEAFERLNQKLSGDEGEAFEPQP